METGTPVALAARGLVLNGGPASVRRFLDFATAYMS
jgi:hypothetical protein